MNLAMSTVSPMLLHVSCPGAVALAHSHEMQVVTVRLALCWVVYVELLPDWKEWIAVSSSTVDPVTALPADRLAERLELYVTYPTEMAESHLFGF